MLGPHNVGTATFGEYMFHLAMTGALVLSHLVEHWVDD